MFMIVNKITRIPMRLVYEMETHGQCYMTYDRPTFSVEEADSCNEKYPIFVTTSREVAEKVIARNFDGEDSIEAPCFTPSWGEGELNEYEVVEVTFAKEGK